ncbi:hypothetical protein [Nocardioides sp. 503]|uniref:hypothetical protein n=1 Tax=Nocardioides sp. 503 TaxID=2508326 RepID=UPI00106F9773|nr:hypothetical protein [Nocardioides sp. 503]
MTADGAPERGERLARWLDDLGLAPHLADAGLPTFERDADGRARWTDPGTGLPLDADQLEQLDRLLHQEGSEPEHAVPVPLLLIARQARLRQELLDTEWLTYETLAELRGASVNATRFAVHKAQDAHRLLVVATESGTVVPAFQLTPAGEPRPDLAPVIAPLLAAGMDPWRAWAWLTQPVGLLGGQVPQLLAADPDEADLVRHAAVRLAERVADQG